MHRRLHGPGGRAERAAARNRKPARRQALRGPQPGRGSPKGKPMTRKKNPEGQKSNTAARKKNPEGPKGEALSRPERRRRQREAARKKPSAAQIAKLNKRRKRAPDDPSSHKPPIASTHAQGQHAINIVARSGAVPILDEKLSKHPGRRSKLTPFAILVAMVLAAEMLSSPRRCDVVAVLAGLDAEIAMKLGICTRRGWDLPSYKVVCKQIKRLERVLPKYVLTEYGLESGTTWLKRVLLKGSIPPRFLKQTRAIAIDSTKVPAWANWECGGDNPVISADPDASHGYHSASAKMLAGIYFGYANHVAVSCKRAVWRQDPRKVSFSDEVPPFVVDFTLTAASANPGPVGAEIALRAKQIAPNIDQVYADRGFTTKNSFKLPLFKAGIDVFMDQTSHVIGRPRTVNLGREKDHQILIEHAGSFFPTWMPKRLLTPPKSRKGKRLAEWYAERSRYAWIVKQKLPGGGVQIKCPQCDGRIKTRAKTPGTKTPGTKTQDAKDPVTVLANIDKTKYCCKGKLVSVSLKRRANVQPIPFGTPAWKMAYAIRNQIENANKGLKDKNGFRLGWCRALGLTANLLGSIMHMVAYNIDLARKARIRSP